MFEFCPNCGAEVARAFCGECGQARNERVTLRYIYTKLLGDLTDFNSGFFYTLWRMTIAPAQAIREYLDGRRKVYANPFKYGFILAAAFVALLMLGKTTDHLSIQFNGKEGGAHKTKVTARAKIVRQQVLAVMDYAKDYANILLMAFIPIQAFFTWMLFRKGPYNFAEHIVLNVYIASQQMAMYAPFHAARLLMPTDRFYVNSGVIYLSVCSVYQIWVYGKLFHAIPGRERYTRILAAFVLYAFVFGVIVLLGLIAIIGVIIYWIHLNADG